MKRRDFLTAVGSLWAVESVFGELAHAVPCPPPSMAVDSGGAVSTSCDTPSTIAYLNGMSAYQVRALSGTYAPTNGVETMRAATNATWEATNHSGDIAAFWSGGHGDPVRREIASWGGGHVDVSNNGIYVYDFNGTTKPTGFKVLPGSQSSTPPSTSSSSESYSDGKPSARHTYDGVVYTGGKLFSFFGSIWNNGNTTQKTRIFTPGSPGSWDSAGVSAPSIINPQGFATGLTAFDPVTKRVFVAAATLNGYGIFDTNTTAYVASGGLSGMSGWQDDFCLGLDTTRNRVVAFGAGYTQSWTVNFASPSVSSSISHGNFRNGIEMYSPIYDSVRDRFWLWGGRGSSGYTSITEVNAATLTVVAERSIASGSDLVSVASSPGGSSSDIAGLWKRVVMLGANNEAIGFIPTFTSPAYVIKLP